MSRRTLQCVRRIVDFRQIDLKGNVMQSLGQQEKLDLLIGLIKEIKPSLVDAVIKPEDTLTETLGLDSLDILQLVRKLRRALGGSEFDLDSWSANKATHRGSIQSVLDAITAPAAA
jgi:acyl carrier protein